MQRILEKTRGVIALLWWIQDRKMTGSEAIANMERRPVVSVFLPRYFYSPPDDSEAESSDVKVAGQLI